MRNEGNAISEMFEFLNSRFIIDNGNDYFSVSCCVLFSYEDEITVIDSFLLHRVSLCSKEEVLIWRCCYLCRYRNICFNIFFCIDRCTAGNTSEEGNIESHLSFIIGNTEIELSSFFSNKISLLYKTVHKKLDRSWGGIS